MPASDLATIDRYADGLAAALRGPSRLRADLVAEARHSLLDAAASYVDSGLPPAEAARRAVEDFGTYADVVPGYQAELAVAQGRRTALVLATALPALSLLAPLMWWRSPWATVQPSAAYRLLAGQVDRLALVAGAAAVVVLLGFRFGGRWTRDGRGYARAVGVGALAVLALQMVAGGALFTMTVWQAPSAAAWPPLQIGMAVNAIGFGYAMTTAWRCVRASRLSARRFAAA